jgi:hypothetical protein
LGQALEGLLLLTQQAQAYALDPPLTPPRQSALLLLVVTLLLLQVPSSLSVA